MNLPGPSGPAPFKKKEGDGRLAAVAYRLSASPVCNGFSV
jgi:hypothetical protein